MIWRLIAGFCVATVTTQCLIVAVLGLRGNLDGDQAVKIVALINGIDIGGQQLQQVINASRTTESPSFEEVLQQRAESGMDMELRRQSIADFHDHVESMLRELQEKEQRFDVRRNAFNARLETLEQGSRQEGMLELQRTIEVLPAEQAKFQLLKFIDEGEIDVVVSITQAMATDKRKRIFSEFESPDERDQLALILRRIGEGEPMKTLIEQARADQ